MTSETGRAGCRMTFHSGRATFNTATFPASDVRDAAEPCNESTHEEQPKGVGESGSRISDRRSQQPDEQHRSSSIAIGDAAPDRGRQQLCDGKRTEEGSDRARLTAEPQGVEGEQRRDHQEPDHIDEAHGDQDDEALQIRAQDSADSLSERRHRLTPTPRTAALSTIRITPNPAATPSSDTRRLDMISIEIGRLTR